MPFELEVDASDEGALDLDAVLDEAVQQLETSVDDVEIPVEGADGGLGIPGDDTMVAGFDERSRRVMQASAQRRAMAGEIVEEQAADEWAVHEELDTSPAERLGEELLFALKVVVDGGRREARVLGYLAQRPFESVLAECPLGGIEDVRSVARGPSRPTLGSQFVSTWVNLCHNI